MPLEIKELHIKVNLEKTPGKEQSETSDTLSGGGQGSTGISKDEMVALCVEKVMEILKYQKER